MELDIQNQLFIEVGQLDNNLYGTSIASVRDVFEKVCIKWIIFIANLLINLLLFNRENIVCLMLVVMQLKDCKLFQFIQLLFLSNQNQLTL